MREKCKRCTRCTLKCSVACRGSSAGNFVTIMIALLWLFTVYDVVVRFDTTVVVQKVQ